MNSVEEMGKGLPNGAEIHTNNAHFNNNLRINRTKTYASTLARIV